MDPLRAAVLLLVCLPALSGALPQSTPAGAGGDSNDHEVRRLAEQARTDVAAGDAAGAMALLQQALAISPNAPQPNLQLGRLMLEQKRYPEAMDRFETVLAIDRRSAEARRGEFDAATSLALESKREGNQQAALACLEHARESLPDDAVLLRYVGVQAFDMHLLAAAAEALQASIKLAPTDVQTTYALARVEAEQQLPVQAERDFRAYLAARPSDASAHYGLGHLLQTQLRLDDAAAEFRRSIELQPVQTESYYQLGQMALDAHRDDEAARLFEQTLARAPQHGGSLTGLGIVAFRAKRYDEAAKRLREAVAAAPDYQPAHYYLGLSLGRMQDAEGAARELKVAADLATEQQGKGAPLPAGAVR